MQTFQIYRMYTTLLLSSMGPLRESGTVINMKRTAEVGVVAILDHAWRYQQIGAQRDQVGRWWTPPYSSTDQLTH